MEEDSKEQGYHRQFQHISNLCRENLTALRAVPGLEELQRRSSEEDSKLFHMIPHVSVIVEAYSRPHRSKLCRHAGNLTLVLPRSPGRWRFQRGRSCWSAGRRRCATSSQESGSSGRRTSRRTWWPPRPLRPGDMPRLRDEVDFQNTSSAVPNTIIAVALKKCQEGPMLPDSMILVHRCGHFGRVKTRSSKFVIGSSQKS